MRIVFHKKNAHVLIMTITRSDGSVTWTKIHPGLHVHDIGHYVVEKHLAFQKAFFGIVDSGVSISDFENKELRKTNPLLKNLPIEALQVEHIVNLLQIEYAQPSDSDNFVIQLKDLLVAAGIPFPQKLTPSVLEKIRTEFQLLAGRIFELPENQTLELKLKFIHNSNA